IVHWGDGKSDTYGSALAPTHEYADGPHTYAVTVDIVDADATFLNRANALSVIVDNVPPTVTLFGPSTANEGDTNHYTFTTSDPGAHDTFSVVAVSGGAKGTVKKLVFDSTTGAGSFDVSFSNPAISSTVSVQVRDSDNANSNVSSINVAVANVLPSISVIK